jgi:eukaryotic-like serine/threonine-protein kinase
VPERVISGRYRLLERLGAGTMAQIWLAQDLELERQVAVKILRPDADRGRFQREARAVAGLSHPNVCRLYDFGETDEGPFMVLEYLPRGSLEARLAAEAPLSDEDSRRIAGEIAAGLAHAHQRGLVHRDLKPANVLFDDEGRAKLADFGIVLLTDTAALTETGTILGTATYISPEQAGGEPATPASDVYSFGAVLFHMLTGRPPFESSSAIDLVRRHRTDPAPPVFSVRPDAPTDLAAVTDAALAKRPAERPADGAALLRAIGRPSTVAAPSLPLEGPPTLVIPRARPARRRGPRKAVLAALAAAVLLATGIATAVLATRDDPGGSSPSLPSQPSLTAPASSSTQPTTTAEGTTEPTTTAESTTTPTTAAPTTIPTTTQPTTTAPVTLAPTTTVATTVPTTEPVTTGPTTDTSGTTTTGTLTQ